MEWREVPGYPFYEVSPEGEVRSWRTRGQRNKRRSEPVLLKQATDRYGYRQVRLTPPEGGPKTWVVHRLVLFAFVGPPEEGTEGSHLNGVRSDNRLVNLAWEDRRANSQRRWSHGTMLLGSGHPRSKLDEAQVARVRAMWKEGHTVACIREAFGVHENSIRGILTGRTWTHVGPALMGCGAPARRRCGPSLH